MSELAIDCRSLRKTYVLGEDLSLRRSVQTVLRRNRGTLEGFDALRDVTFTVERGAFFGIVGANGSGKSTLTQIMAGISSPASGSVRVWGRLLPLLEIGAGFHQDLTGRENVQLLGAILGLEPSAVKASMPRVAEFSGVERHLDTPLKRYSSGMQARLSFAAAICFPSDIYVFDEVLAVVDDSFRDQCVEEMNKMNAAGKTILFMSHDLDLVTDLCRTGMWLDHGHVRHVGDIADVGDAYRAGTVISAAA
jgi:ABC-2 type transport system ATP-binding protein/lipopolysaccharide transport system ATP-binding protein